MATADECRERLERAGVRLDEARDLVVGAMVWEVSGRCAGRWVSAQGGTREEAWQDACRQALAPGLPPPA
jgi:hypothetical protein